MDWTVGNKVRHSTAPQWGLGEVIEVVGYDKVRVYFWWMEVKSCSPIPTGCSPG